MKLLQQWVKTDEKSRSTLYSQYDNGTINAEPITPEQAAQWVAENGF